MISSGIDRRAALAAAVVAVSSGGAVAAGKPSQGEPTTKGMAASAFGLDPTSVQDQSDRFQSAVDQAAARRVPLVLPAGRYLVGNIQLRPGTRLVAAAASTVLAYNGKGVVLQATDAADIRLDGLEIDGGFLPLRGAGASALVHLSRCTNARLADLAFRNSDGHGLKLEAVGGNVEGCRISAVKGAAIFSLDSTGLSISRNDIAGCQNNGILVWRSAHGDDKTRVFENTISSIAAAAGGTGQNGNGINIYRAAGVMVAGNRISDCAYSAVRANEASNVQITANQAGRIGEVALYAEAADERAGAAGFEGAVIANNVVDAAAAGIVVTNFNNGARLSTVTGNMVRNLFRREHEPQDKRGEGIAVEADAVVANNVIENAPTAGIMIGWGRHMREVVATGNLVRRCRIGIAVSGAAGVGQCLLANNLVSGATDGAIRLMDHARPVGGDLLRGERVPSHLQLSGNMATA